MAIDWTTVIVSALSGTGVVATVTVAYVNTRENQRKQAKADEIKREELRVEMRKESREHEATLMQQVESLRGELMELSAKAAEWRVVKDILGEDYDIRDLLRAPDVSKAGRAEIRRFIKTSSMINWCQERLGPNDYAMLAVSYPYARTYLGGPPELYEGKTNVQFYPPEDAKRFNEADEQVYADQLPLAVIEDVSGSPSGATGWFVGIKRPYKLLSGGDLIEGKGWHFNEDEKDIAEAIFTKLQAGLEHQSHA